MALVRQVAAAMIAATVGFHLAAGPVCAAAPVQLISIKIDAKDELPLLLSARAPVGDPLVTVSGNTVSISADAFRESASRAGIRRSPSVNAPEDVRAIVVADVSYSGIGRWWSARIVWLLNDIADFTVPRSPATIRVTPGATEDDWDYTPWPTNLSFAADEQGSIRVGGDLLAAGASLKMGTIAAAVDVEVERWPDVPLGPLPAGYDPEPIIETFPKVHFTSSVTMSNVGLFGIETSK